MSDEALFEFTGIKQVQEFFFSRTEERTRLALTIHTENKRVRLMFLNPYPEEGLFAIIDAAEVWVRATDGEDPGRIRVDYWVDGFCHFIADSVVDLEAGVFETNPTTGVVIHQG